MATTPIVLVPGFWLGAWAWDDVVAALRTDGHDEVTSRPQELAKIIGDVARSASTD